jgi:hypothetical protein
MLFGQNPLKGLSGTVDSLLGDWESMLDDRLTIAPDTPQRTLHTLTFRQSADGTLHVADGYVDVNQVRESSPLGAVVEEYDLHHIEQGIFEFRLTGEVIWKFGVAKLNNGMVLPLTWASTHSRGIDKNRRAAITQ